MARRCDKEGLRAYQREYMRRRRARPEHVEPGPSNPAVQREKYRLRSAAYRAEHPDRARAAQARWFREHPERVRMYFLKRRALRDGAVGTCSIDQLRARVAYYGGKCWVPGCGKAYEAIDHVIALARGGSNWPANLRPICKKHNSQKKDRDWRAVCPSR